MKKLVYLLLPFALTFNLQAEGIKSVNFDLSTSLLRWTGKKVTGSHSGELRIKAAEGAINSNNTISGSFDIDMNTLKNTDIETPKDNKKLVDHLKSADFFSVKNYPDVKFKITQSTPIETAKPGESNVVVNGELSIKGVTQPISFPATIQIDGNKLKASAVASVDRTKFDIRYGSGKFFQGLGDKLIYDNFEVAIELNGSIN